MGADLRRDVPVPGASGPERSGGQPSVTVLIPAYNAAAFVEDAIRSALGQTYRDLEVLVVDDGSTDPTPQRAGAFGGPVRLLGVSHGGLSWARNHGMRAAAGRFVIFLDADDILERELVARAVDLLERRPDLGFVFPNFRWLFADGRSSPPVLAPEGHGGESEMVLEDPVRQLLLAGYSISPSGLGARREMLAEAGYFDESLWGSEDFEYLSRVYLRRPVGFLTAPLVRRRHHTGSMTSQFSRMAPCVARSIDTVARRFLAAGRLDSVRAIRRYGRRCMETVIRGLLSRGEGRQAFALLLRYRRLLWGPRLPLLAAACWVPRPGLRALRRARGWFSRDSGRE